MNKSLRLAMETPERASAPVADDVGTGAQTPYAQDAFERWILFLDTLRERADNMIAHERQDMPPLLDFDYELLLDARSFERPANYALLRITRVGEDCWDDCVDEAKPPVIVIDPRAGHGPGIGGFKRDSEVGMAMHEGHPVYFVIFFPEPVPGQTLADVHYALRDFVSEVARRHRDTAPVLYGNCQAGWAATLLAADCEGLTGPIVLNGSPLSYWSGEAASSPMRMMGALTGGAWAAHMISDLGDGRFDGAWLAQNFETLQPEKAIWDKYATLFAHADTERERFLEFERWWNGYYTLSREEILAITQNLFIGNKLEQGEMQLDDHCTIDLRRIENPMIIFASEGDNITPPEQAMGWIAKLYPDTDALKAAGQRIVYMTHGHVGHLGIFVSGSVARLQHRAILESLDKVEALAPGLYEMVIDTPAGDPDCETGDFTVRFVPREVHDLRIASEDAALAQVAQVSRINEAAYSAFVSPWLRAATSPASAEALRALHPMRWTRTLFSERVNPWMALVKSTAETLRETRDPLPEDHLAIVTERALSARTGEVLGAWRKGRDAWIGHVFGAMFGPFPVITAPAQADHPDAASQKE
ncbi:DUF3141 domain-containing protein [Alterinioella nitratireducens]|uniref:DUF3141 domain-containing protein n=1 Tax=Alterinioella nitratireducens TaxID=2735915 RepID=UPI0015557831|nr:DUF3141 domain-containing protein [Alterinioella nitratireducens]NPD18963.1 DUF3141 domain-containing protein [Alterinioella nitratireducens]